MRRGRRAWRTAAGYLALLVFLCASIGVLPPLPRLIAQSSAKERFPCETCPCGCGSARECWTACCCHTVEERLAWATENGVEIPSYARSVFAKHLRPIAAKAAGASLSPLACKGIGAWQVLPLPPMVRESGSWRLIQTPDPVMAMLPPGEESGTRVLEVEPPPPRA